MKFNNNNYSRITSDTRPIDSVICQFLCKKRLLIVYRVNQIAQLLSLQVPRVRELICFLQCPRHVSFPPTSPVGSGSNTSVSNSTGRHYDPVNCISFSRYFDCQWSHVQLSLPDRIRTRQEGQSKDWTRTCSNPLGSQPGLTSFRVEARSQYWNPETALKI